MTREHASRLDEHMDQRRLELGMKWRDVAAAARISYEALRAARMGEGTPAPLTRSGIERALRWAPGSIDAVLAGGEPTLAQDRQAAGKPTVEELEARVAELEREVANILADRKQHDGQKKHRNTA